MPGIRKSLTVIIICCLLFFISYNPLQAQVIPLDRLTRVEEIIYGAPQELPILQRITALEKTLYGAEQGGTLLERAVNIINYVLPAADEPSLLFLVNTLEWTLTGDINRQPLLTRISSLEQAVYGETRGGSLKQRIDSLLDLSLPDRKIPAKKVTLPADKLIRIKLMDKLSSAEAKVGQEINFEVVSTIKHNGTVVITRGSEGSLTVNKVEKAGKMGKDGELEINFEPIGSIDGTMVPVKLDEEAQEENRSRKLAVGASVLGTVILGPVGLIAGYFVEGEEEELPAGTELYIQTEDRVELYGLVLQ